MRKCIKVFNYIVFYNQKILLVFPVGLSVKNTGLYNRGPSTNIPQPLAVELCTSHLKKFTHFLNGLLWGFSLKKTNM